MLKPENGSAHFSPELFKFLKDLARNNNREWFAKNKPRYEKFLLDVSARFIKDAGPKLKSISQYLVADPKPTGGSLFRIYRDIRFSKDKSPLWIVNPFRGHSLVELFSTHPSTPKRIKRLKQIAEEIGVYVP